MKVSYWLEFQVAPPLSSLASLLPRACPMAPGIFRMCEEHWEDSPPWCRVDELLDTWEDVQDHWLPQAGLVIQQATVWMQYESKEEELSIDIDPLTLSRLGEADLQLCIQGHHHREAEPHINWVPCQLNGCWSWFSPQVGLGSHEVEVWLSDHSLWRGLATTRQQLIDYWHPAQQPTTACHWQPSLLILDTFEEEAIERGVVVLLRQGRFEEVFRQVEAGEEEGVAPRSSGWELRVLYEPRRGNPLVGLRPELPTWRAAANPQGVDALQRLLQDLKPLQPSLRAHGILKRDLTLVWHQPYRRQAQLVLTPDMLLSVGSQGHHLAANFFPQTDRTTRYLED